MDDGFPIEFWQSHPFWVDAPISVPVSTPTTPVSAFVPYLPRPAVGTGRENNLVAGAAVSGNVNRRVIEYWRNQWRENKGAAAGENVEREKCHRHMLNERMRREKERRSYFQLHSMLPIKTKSDKKSVVQMAARMIEELRVSEEMLKRRNLELEMAISAKKKEIGTIPIRVSLANPSSGINSMLAVLNVLKTVGVNAKAIHATFLDSQFSAQLAIQTHMRGTEVESALQLTLCEAERKFQRQCHEGSNGADESSNLNNNNKWGPRGGSRISSFNPHV